MALLVPRRVDTAELLDEEDAPHQDMERSLRDLKRINRWLGGVAVYRRLMRRFAKGTDIQRVVDVGTGTSDLLEAIPEVRLRVGVDFKIDHLLYGRSSGLPGSSVLRVVADAAALPFRDLSVDVVTSAHFFHHFGRDANLAILGEALRVARRGAIVNDTRRHYAPLLMVRLLGALRLVGRITRFDAPASVQRAYTLPEARAVAAATDAHEIRVFRAFPFRFGLLLRK